MEVSLIQDRDRYSRRETSLMANMEPIFKTLLRTSRMKHQATKITLTSLFSQIRTLPQTETHKRISNLQQRDNS